MTALAQTTGRRRLDTHVMDHQSPGRAELLDRAEGGAGAGTAADRDVVLAVDWPRPAARR